MVSTHFHFNGFSPNMLYFFLVSLQALLGYPNFYYRAFLHYNGGIDILIFYAII